MDPNGNVIPIVEGDQGEGFKDPYEEKGDDGTPFKKLLEEKMEETVNEKRKDFDRKILTAQPDAQPRKPPPSRMRMKKGMRIHFYGYSYKVTAVRPNGKVTLRFDGIWKEVK